MSFLFVGCPITVLIPIFGNLSQRILTTWKQVQNGDSRWLRLRFAITGSSFLLLRPFLLLLFYGYAILATRLSKVLKGIFTSRSSCLDLSTIVVFIFVRVVVLSLCKRWADIAVIINAFRLWMIDWRRISESAQNFWMSMCFYDLFFESHLSLGRTYLKGTTCNDAVSLSYSRVGKDFRALHRMFKKPVPKVIVENWSNRMVS